MTDAQVSFGREVWSLDSILNKLEETLREIGKRLDRLEGELQEDNSAVKNSEYNHSWEEHERLEEIIFYINEAASRLEEISPITVG